MDALFYIHEAISGPAIVCFIKDSAPDTKENYLSIREKIRKVHEFMFARKFIVLPEDEKKALIDMVQQTAHKVGGFMSEIVESVSAKQSSSFGSPDLVKNWKKTLDLINDLVEASNYSKQKEGMLEFINEEVLNDIKRDENMLFETTDSINCITLNEDQSRKLFLKKALPPIEIINFTSIPSFIYGISNELDDLPLQICNACEGQPLALLLIGCLISFKPIAYDTWNRVKDDLVKIKESNYGVMSNHMWHIFTYCCDDLPHYLKHCFLYLACYPIGYEISAASLTKMWIAEGFLKAEPGETVEETAMKYLQEFVKRSLVCVSKRSILGTIKCCRVSPSIHEFVIKQSKMEGFLVANPDQQEIESVFRLAIHPNNKKQYMEVKNNHICSILAFNFDRNVLGSAVLLRVLELRKSAIPVIDLPNMICLRYLGLRGSNICELPKHIGDMKILLTLDVRDTNIETLPESLWNISTLRHVYVKPSPKIKGPPSTANIPDLQILKTIVPHDSWQENIPHFLIHLTHLALSNCDNLGWKSISNLLSHMDKLISMAIMSNIIPSESIDTRAFPNLQTVKSIKLEGQWNCRKLFIDNVKFPPNLTKLTLINSGLKEDPMPTLERLRTLKFLSLQHGAYTGKQMVCSTNGFPQLQFLQLKKLENLENWEVNPTAMSRLTTLSVIQCQKLNNLPNLEGVIINDIDD